LELLDAERAGGITLFVATHELDYVRRVDRCLALRDGHLVHDGPTDGVDVLQLVT
jgi:energy-coupling factor transporter ATP-binding protein EcfA2